MVDRAWGKHDTSAEESISRIRELVGSISKSKTLQEVIPGFRTQKGIYEPSDSDYALWIRQTARGVYGDKEPDVLPDGSWTYEYMPEAKNGKTDLTLSTNKSLLNCMNDKVPIGVFIQKRIPNVDRSYLVLGIGYVETFDGTHFIIRGEPIDNEDAPMSEHEIRSFEPFEREPSRLSPAIRVIRERSFQVALRRAYHDRCSLCELGYVYRGQPIGVEGAHIIPVSNNGTSKDVRNGILLCRNHHSLFDSQLWAFDEDYRVLVAEDRPFRASAARNCVLNAEGKRLPNLPDKLYDYPAVEAIRFNLRKFFRT